ncbi:MAG: GDP-mannose 4,6-dehydratase [Candidatus Aminicenantes bacterium]|nr:GDP-mannose 4,6-dehydratase [Candidatus Aminicenantes bacterium]
MKVLITGITGFAGSHLAEYILNAHKDVEVSGIVRWRSRLENVRHILGKVHLHEADLKDMVSIKAVLAAVRPDRIFHLAAQSFVPASWRLPAETFATNAIGEINLFESCRALRLNPRIHVAGSSEEYGMVYPDEIPMKETNPLRPLSPYAVSKVAQDLLAFQYHRSYGLRVVRTRGFNHTGPRRGDVFVTSCFAKQIAEVELGKREAVINVGNLDAKRDFTDVRDVVRAYWLTLEKGKPGEVYNIGSGKAHAIKEVLDILLSMSRVRMEVRVDPERLRPSDVPILLSDSTKFHKLTGWEPRIPFRKTLEDLLNYWRGYLAAEDAAIAAGRRAKHITAAEAGGRIEKPARAVQRREKKKPVRTR